MNRKVFTTRQVGHICNVTFTTIIDWIEKGQLKAHKTLGGHRRVLKKDLINFLKKNNFPIPEELEYEDLKKLLIVDDDPKILNSLSTVLKKKNDIFKIYTAVDGFEAGQKVVKYKPDIVLLDLKLPGIDGFRVCQLIKKHDNKIKIIAITGYYSEITKKKIFSAGANCFFKKPIDLEELLKAIENLLNIKVKPTHE